VLRTIATGQLRATAVEINDGENATEIMIGGNRGLEDGLILCVKEPRRDWMPAA